MRGWGTPSSAAGRDRAIVALFAAQLAAAIVLGAVLIHGLDRADRNRGVQVTGRAGGAPGSDAGPATTDGTGGGTPAGGDAGSGPGSAATGHPTTTVTGSPAGSAGATPGGVPLAAGAPIKVGVLVTQTGAINFKPAAQAAKAYFDMVNEAGGVNGHRIDVLLRDDQLDATRGQAAVKEMLNAGVFAFAAWNAPLTEESIVKTLEDNRIPLVGNYGQLAEYRTRWAYPLTALYVHYGYVMAGFLADLGVKTPGVVFISNADSETDNLIRRGYREGFAARGIKLDDNNVYAVDVTKASYDDTVAQLRLAQVDGVATLLDNTAYVRLQQSLNRAAYHPTHVASPLLADPDVLADPGIGRSLDGTYLAADLEFIDTGGPEAARYSSEVRRRFGGEAKVNWAGEVSWLGAKLFVEGLRRAGPEPTREGLLAALDALTGYETGLTVPFTIRPGGHDINKCLELGKIAAGKVVKVKGWTCSPARWQ